MDNKKRKIEALDVWQEISLEYPSLHKTFQCKASQIPTLEQINCLLISLGKKRQPELESACYSLLELLRDKSSTDQSAYQIDLFNLLPDEILCMIFGYLVQESTLSQICSYYLVSKRVYSIVREVYNQWRKELVSSVRGFPIKISDCLTHTKKFSDYLTDDIRSLPYSDRLRELIQESIFKIHLGFSDCDDIDSGIAIGEFHPSRVESALSYMNFSCQYYFQDDLEEMGFSPNKVFKGIDDIIWNDKKLIIGCPIHIYNDFHTKRFFYLHENTKGYFTIRDIIERVYEFYQTGIHSWEWDYLLYQIQDVGMDIFERFPTQSDIVNKVLQEIVSEAGQDNNCKHIQNLANMIKGVNSIHSVMDQLVYFTMIKLGIVDSIVANEFIESLREGKISKREVAPDDRIRSITIKIINKNCAICNIKT